MSLGIGLSCTQFASTLILLEVCGLEFRNKVAQLLCRNEVVSKSAN